MPPRAGFWFKRSWFSRVAVQLALSFLSLFVFEWARSPIASDKAHASAGILCPVLYAPGVYAISGLAQE